MFTFFCFPSSATRPLLNAMQSLQSYDDKMVQISQKTMQQKQKRHHSKFIFCLIYYHIFGDIVCTCRQNTSMHHELWAIGLDLCKTFPSHSKKWAITDNSDGIIKLFWKMCAINNTENHFIYSCGKNTQIVSIKFHKILWIAFDNISVCIWIYKLTESIAASPTKAASSMAFCFCLYCSSSSHSFEILISIWKRQYSRLWTTITTKIIPLLQWQCIDSVQGDKRIHDNGWW